jgi:hypothetical protein
MERKERNAMSGLITVRYQSGDTEFRMSDDAPTIGDVVMRRGEEWVIESVIESDQGFRVMLRPRDRPPAGQADGERGQEGAGDGS